MLSLMAPNYISRYISARRALIQDLFILPTVDPISFLRGSLDVLLLTAKMVMLIHYFVSNRKMSEEKVEGTRQNAIGLRRESRTLLLTLIAFSLSFLGKLDQIRT